VLKEHPGLTHAFIVHGITGIDDCARDPAGTARVNVGGTQRVIDDLVDHGIVPVFASSDAVFDGSRGLWSEEDPVGPIGTYGRQKVEVERYLLDQAAPALVLRLAKVVSATAGANDLLEDWLNQLESREAIIRCAKDQVLSPVTVSDAAEAFVRLANDGKTGIFHVCGPRPVSRLQLLEMLRQEASRYGDLPAQIIPCSIHDLKLAEVRPLDNSMSPSKLYAALGCSFDDPRETCRKAAASRYAV
jgi:dTDP-4-dehydrorhamnose reductase